MAKFLHKMCRTQRGRAADLLVFGYIRGQESLKSDKMHFPDEIIIACNNPSTNIVYGNHVILDGSKYEWRVALKKFEFEKQGTKTQTPI